MYLFGTVVNSLRGKICDELEDFMLEGDREKFSRELTDAEDWLYEDGEFADKKTYTYVMDSKPHDH